MRSAALGAGFQLFGVAGTEAADVSAGADRFTDWVEAGRAGEMEYLKRRDSEGRLLRSRLQVALPWARSVAVCGLNYNAAAPRSIDEAGKTEGWIGRYAWSGRRSRPEALDSSASGSAATLRMVPTDYHLELMTRLRVVEARLRERMPDRASLETRCYVDTGPIVEREFAAEAGVGWIGKNTCVINQQVGSWLLLGVIVTSLPMEERAVAIAAVDRCGSCTRCIDACPTDALVAPREMDAARCIAYLTIEKKGTIDPELRAAMGRQVFGCDICQDVCPWNRRAPVAVVPGMEARQELVNPSLEWLAQLDSSAFKRWFKGSPLERTGKKRLHRNVAIAMGNSGEEEFLHRLAGWAAGDDAVLAEAATWAIGRIRGSASIKS